MVYHSIMKENLVVVTFNGFNYRNHNDALQILNAVIITLDK